MMKQILYILLGIMLLSIVSCYDDEGNYDYHEINEVTYGDTLKIDVGDFVEMSQGDLTDTDRFEYLWVIFSPSDSHVKDTISTDRVLSYPVTLAPGTYNLYLKIRDRVTEVQWKKQFTVTVGTPYSRGILLMGEDANGNADAAGDRRQRCGGHEKHRYRADFQAGGAGCDRQAGRGGKRRRRYR